MILGDLLHVVDVAKVRHALDVHHLGLGVRVEVLQEARVVEADVVTEACLDRLHLWLRHGHLEDTQTLTEVLARDVSVVVSAMRVHQCNQFSVRKINVVVRFVFSKTRQDTVLHKHSGIAVHVYLNCFSSKKSKM